MELRELGDGAWEQPGPRGMRPLVCLPGLLGDGRIFAPYARVASARRRVVALDLRESSLEAESEALPARLDALGLERPDILSGSYGGLVAWRLRSSRIHQLATVGTLPSAAMLPLRMRLMPQLLDRVPGRVVHALYRSHQRSGLAEDGVPPELVFALSRRALDKRLLVGRLDSVVRWPIPERLPAPTLWVLGATDPMAAWSVREVMTHRPRVEVTHVPGGHRPYASHPWPLWERLRLFWSTNPAGSTA